MIWIHSFRFWSTPEHRSRAHSGDYIQFCSGSGSALDHLGSGWSAAEATHTWSLGAISDLWFATDDKARMVAIQVSGNPHVPGGQQSLTIELNSEEVALVQIDGGGKTSFEVDCQALPWLKDQNNHLIFKPSASAAPPAGSGDARNLGFCLWSILVR